MEIGRIDPPVYKNQTQMRVQAEVTRVEPVKEMETTPSVKEVEKKVEGLNTFLMTTNSQLRFQLHEELNEYYVTIINEQTNEIIKEIPSKKLLDIHAAMKEMIGMMIDKKI